MTVSRWFNSIWASGGIGTGVALVVALSIYAAARLVGDPLAVASQPGGDDYRQLPVGAVVIVTIVAGLVAIGVAWLSKQTPVPLTVFLAVVVIGFLFMLYPPISSAEVPSTTAWLIAMHAGVAVQIIGALSAHILRTTPAE